MKKPLGRCFLYDNNNNKNYWKPKRKRTEAILVFVPMQSEHA